MPFRPFLVLFLVYCTQNPAAQGQKHSEWLVFDQHRKVVSHLDADSMVGFSHESVLVFRDSVQQFCTLQGKPLTLNLDSAEIRIIRNEPFAIIKPAGSATYILINGNVQTVASGFQSVEFFYEAALLHMPGNGYQWVSMHQAYKNLYTFDSISRFADGTLLARRDKALYWLNPQHGPILLHVPRHLCLAAITKALPIENGRVHYLALIVGGHLRLFNAKGAALPGTAKATVLRPALSGFIYLSGTEWYYQDPAKAAPVPLKGKVVSADPQKIIVNRQGKFFAYWKGGRATWLKLETADSVGLFHQGLAGFRYKGKYGFVDSIGYIRIAARYQYASDFVGGYSIVKAGGKWGVIDKRENFVVQPFNDTIWAAHSLFAQQSANRVFLFDPVAGSTSESYDQIRTSPDGFITQKAGRSGYINTKAKTVLAPRFDSILTIPALKTVAYRQNGLWFFPEGSLGKVRSARRLSVCPVSGYCFVQPGNLE